MIKSNHNSEPAECVMVRGILVDLSDVSPELRDEYHRAVKALGRADQAGKHFDEVKERILAEAAPQMAEKAFKNAHARSRMSGSNNAAIASLRQRGR